MKVLAMILPARLDIEPDCNSATILGESKTSKLEACGGKKQSQG